MKYSALLISSVLLTISFAVQGQIDGSVATASGNHSIISFTADSPASHVPANRKVSFSHKGQTLSGYIADHFEYPAIAKENCLEGTAIIQFEIDAEGKITNPKIIQSVHPIVDVIIVDFITEMPDWKPRVYNGRKISSVVELPFTFGLR